MEDLAQVFAMIRHSAAEDARLGELLAEAVSCVESHHSHEIKGKLVYPCQSIELPGVTGMAGLEDLKLLDYFGGKVSLYLVRENEEFISLLTVFGDKCKDVLRAQQCITVFLSGVLGGLFTVPGAVESKIDSLMLESMFAYEDTAETASMVSLLLKVLKSERFRAEATPMLECFE